MRMIIISVALSLNILVVFMAHVKKNKFEPFSSLFSKILIN